jgi:hypothetical protein
LGGEYFTKHGLNWNSLGKALISNLMLLQISKLVGKEFQVLSHLAWKDNDLVGNTGSCNEEITTVFDNVNASANLISFHLGKIYYFKSLIVGSN